MTEADIPEELLCPITCQIMHDPVMASDGHTYDRAAIERWFVEHSTSPRTGAALESKALTPVYALRSLVDRSLSEEQVNERRLGDEARAQVPAITSESIYQNAIANLKVHYPEFKSHEFIYPLILNEIKDLIEHRSSFERLAAEANISLSDFAFLTPIIRVVMIGQLDALANLVLEAKIPFREIPDIESYFMKNFGITLFGARKNIIQLADTGISWGIFSKLEKSVKKIMLKCTSTLCDAISSTHMPLDRFFELTSSKQYAFMEAIYDINYLIKGKNLTWEQVFEVDEKYYPVIKEHSFSFRILLTIESITLDFLLSQPSELLEFLTTNAAMTVECAKTNVLSVNELLTFSSEDRKFLVKNWRHMDKAPKWCKVSEILALDSDDRDFLIKISPNDKRLIEEYALPIKELLQLSADDREFVLKKSRHLEGMIKGCGLSISEVLAFNSEGRDFLLRNHIKIRSLATGCNISIFDVLALNDEERDFLVKYEYQAREIHRLRNSNKNLEDRAVNLPSENVDRARWTINELKKCLQPDGSFKGLEGRVTPAAPIKLFITSKKQNQPTPGLLLLKKTQQPADQAPKQKATKPMVTTGGSTDSHKIDIAPAAVSENIKQDQVKKPSFQKPQVSSYGSINTSPPQKPTVIRRRVRVEPKKFKLTIPQDALIEAGIGITLLGAGLWIALAVSALAPEALGSSAAITTFLTIAWPAAIGLVGTGIAVVLATSIYACITHQCDIKTEVKRPGI